MVIGQREGRGRGRGLCHVEDHDRPTLVDTIEDMDMLPVVPLDSAEAAHPPEEPSDHIHSSGVAPTASSSTSVKRPRGKNKNLKFNAIIDKNGPLTLQFKNKCRVPVGENAEAWSRIVSKIVYNHCDLHYSSWRKVPTAMVRNLEERVKDKFALNMELEQHRNALKYQLNLSYRRHRSNLHLNEYKIFFENVDSQDLAAMANAKLEVRANAPEGIAPGQWPIICDSFETELWKKISERNKKNRAEMQTNHTAGSSPFVNVVYKKAMMTKATPNPIEIYKETHFSEKNKKFVNEYAESKYKEMESMASNSDDANISPEDIVLKVLGGYRSGHVRGQGCGAIPIWSNSSSTHNHDECLSKQLETEHKLAESLEKSAKLEESQAALKAEMNASQAALQAQIDRILTHMGGIGGSSHGSQPSESNV